MGNVPPTSVKPRGWCHPHSVDREKWDQKGSESDDGPGSESSSDSGAHFAKNHCLKVPDDTMLKTSQLTIHAVQARGRHRHMQLELRREASHPHPAYLWDTPSGRAQWSPYTPPSWVGLRPPVANTCGQWLLKVRASLAVGSPYTLLLSLSLGEVAWKVGPSSETHMLWLAPKGCKESQTHEGPLSL